MKSDEVRIAEAIASLTARLESWNVDEPNDKAHGYVTDMLRHGWRPRAAPVETPPKLGRRVPADDARVCWCGVNPARCRIHKTETEESHE